MIDVVWADWGLDEQDGWPLVLSHGKRCNLSEDQLLHLWNQRVGKGPDPEKGRGWRLKDEEAKREEEEKKANPSEESITANFLRFTDDGLFPDTDVANAKKFVLYFGADVLYVDDWSHWAVYDGMRWVPDKSGVLIEGKAKDTTIRMAREAAGAIADVAMKRANGEGNEESLQAEGKRQQALLEWAKRCQDNKKIHAMLSLAKSERSILVRFARDTFDKQAYLLNCPNETVDLRTGELRPHDRADFLTKLCPTKYLKDANRKGYLSFLSKIFLNKPGVKEYVRRLSGYIATGETCDHTTHFWWGFGSNGKSVLQLLWLEALGKSSDGYAHVAPPELLIDDGGNRHPTEKVGLRGARLVICNETKEDVRLDEQKLKELTGDDVIKARGMRQDFFEFHPTHKLIVPTNHKPKIKGTDEGIWRRIRLVPFEFRFWKESDRQMDPYKDTETGPGKKYDSDREADTGLLERLKGEELEGILADMVEQATAYYAAGKSLSPPEEVAKATAEYRQSEDTVGQFLDSQVAKTESAEERIGAGELYAAFKSWYTDEGHVEKSIPGVKRFGKELKKRFQDGKSNGKIVYEAKLLFNVRTREVGSISSKNGITPRVENPSRALIPEKASDPPCVPSTSVTGIQGNTSFKTNPSAPVTKTRRERL